MSAVPACPTRADEGERLVAVRQGSSRGAAIAFTAAARRGVEAGS